MLLSKLNIHTAWCLAHLTKRSVILATGLIALVDDCIKRRFHSKTKHHQVAVPGTSTTMEFVTPKAMVEHMFKRRNSGGSSKSEREPRSSPLRYANPVAAY